MLGGNQQSSSICIRYAGLCEVSELVNDLHLLPVRIAFRNVAEALAKTAE